MTGHTVRIDLAQVRLYHGGIRRLRPGDLILPPDRTRAPCASDYGSTGVHRRDRVYLTIDVDAARFFAAMYAGRKPNGQPITGRGDVYEVTPLAALEHDADCSTPGYSFQVAAARVVRVIDRFVTLPGIGPDELADLILAAGGLDTATLSELGQRTPAGTRAAK